MERKSKEKKQKQLADDLNMVEYRSLHEQQGDRSTEKQLLRRSML